MDPAPIYLDHNGTTPVAPEVAEAMWPYLTEHFGNPSSTSALGRKAKGAVEATWTISGGGSPDMGNVSADGKTLWLSGRYDNVVYRFDTTTGGVDKVKVGLEPHGLTVWPQPGRYSLGHTGNLR